MTINEKVFNFLKEKGAKNSYLALRLDISQQYLGQILKGKKNVTLDFLLNLKKEYPEIDLNKLTEDNFSNIVILNEPNEEYTRKKTDDKFYNSLLEIKKILEIAQI